MEKDSPMIKWLKQFFAKKTTDEQRKKSKVYHGKRMPNEEPLAGDIWFVTDSRGMVAATLVVNQDLRWELVS